MPRTDSISIFCNNLTCQTCSKSQMDQESAEKAAKYLGDSTRRAQSNLGTAFSLIFNKLLETVTTSFGQFHLFLATIRNNQHRQCFSYPICILFILTLKFKMTVELNEYGIQAMRHSLWCETRLRFYLKSDLTLPNLQFSRNQEL